MTGQLLWRWHRLRAMGPGEVMLHLQKKVRQKRDKDFVLRNGHTGHFTFRPAEYPRLPGREEAPEVLKEELRVRRSEILAGRWKAFGRLELQMDDPPRWSRDYLAGVEVEARESAFKLNHRQLPGGADIKLVWELGRWHELVRLAQCAWILSDQEAGGKCLDWLEDWVEQNPPYRGWHWTSALEVGMRLVAFVWMDALLSGEPAWGERLERLRAKILPAHVRYAWRYRSFGSSANNHLIGELAGMILALARFPGLEEWAAPLEKMQALWEREVLLQFAPDGGNREQAQNYHLYSWEFCWHTRAALLSRGCKISEAVEERLLRAAEFFCAVQAGGDAWDYGDSDNAFVLPVFLRAESGFAEWRAWMAGLASPAIEYWCGEMPRVARAGVGGGEKWTHFQESGYAVVERGEWFLRFDVSPLGYLATAAHGHLDALHLSVWHGGKALVVDPGTGAYYSDAALRNYLAGWDAHNGPHPPRLDYPRRAGPFLWACSHDQPVVHSPAPGSMSATLKIPNGEMQREVQFLAGENGWKLEDTFRPANGGGQFLVHWQFPPGAELERAGDGEFRLVCGAAQLGIRLDERWSRAETRVAGSEFAGTCSPAFRQIEKGPFLRLHWDGNEPAVLSTTFLSRTK